jgi:predicted nucleic acid-binding Zn ribbon protein
MTPRRRTPRTASTAFRAALEGAAPKTRLATVQAAWSETVGERVAAAAEPVSERAGTITVRCLDPVWAQELELMQEQLLELLRGRLGSDAPETLRFRADDGSEWAKK